MVFYFDSNDEELIKFGVDEDVWYSILFILRFHVDKLSSAHVYIRLKIGETWEEIDKETLQDVAQLTKANSIEGNKKDNICIIYTPWSNLKKSGDMAIGQVKRIHVDKRRNEIINRLNRSKKEVVEENFDKLKNDHNREKKRLVDQAKRNEEKWSKLMSKENKKKGYDDLFNTESPQTNTSYNTIEEAEEDFM